MNTSQRTRRLILSLTLGFPGTQLAVGCGGGSPPPDVAADPEASKTKINAREQFAKEQKALGPVRSSGPHR